MVSSFVIASFGAAVVGLLLAIRGESVGGLALIVFACHLATFARIVQAANHEHDRKKRLDAP